MSLSVWHIALLAGRMRPIQLDAAHCTPASHLRCFCRQSCCSVQLSGFQLSHGWNLQLQMWQSPFRQNRICWAGRSGHLHSPQAGQNVCCCVSSCTGGRSVKPSPATCHALTGRLVLSHAHTWMADMQSCPAWIGKHIQNVGLGLGCIQLCQVGCSEGFVLEPILLPSSLYISEGISS